MKKLLLTSAVVGGLVAAAASPAMAEVQLGLGGHMKGYVAWNDQDDQGSVGVGGGFTPGVSSHDWDILRETEVHFTGETTLDNGLTVGFHAETYADLGQSMNVNESYAYFAGNWGRVNFGAEDGAAFLLQVAAPAADSNIDGIRQYVEPINFATLQTGAVNAAAVAQGRGRLDAVLARTGTVNGQAGGNGGAGGPGHFDYAQDVTGDSDKITYITPVFYGFQAAASVTPTVNGASRTYGVFTDSTAGIFDNAWEVAGRYEGQFQAARITLGGGYSHENREGGALVTAGTSTTDRKAWNLGANVGFGPFNVGGAYKKDDNGLTGNNDTKTWVVGADYTTGPFVIGASYYDRKDELGQIAGAANQGDLTTKRYSGGVSYTYGPGMSFRGSVSHIKFDDVGTTAGAGASPSATSVLLGTQIGF